jgi:two-component system sensor histidine kinase BaeS
MRSRRRWRGFGCFFGLLFLIVLGSMVAVAGLIVSSFGWLAGLVVAAVIVAIIVWVGRSFRRTGEVLDELVDATERVERGDYSGRVPVPARGPRPLRELVRGFDTMVERLETDERQRRSLLADVSHELRTPLAVLRGNVEAILDGVHPADEVHLGALLEETKVLERLLEDLRTVALSEAGTLALHREPVELGIVAADVATSFRARAATAGVTLDLEAPDDLPLLDADPVRLREILSNLVDNAIQHAPRGGRVAIRLETSAQEVRMSVADTGKGISPELLPHVFDRFAKGPDSRGSGLGLAIARALTEAHGGTIQARSDAGHGTTMIVHLPTS